QGEQAQKTKTKPPKSPQQQWAEALVPYWQAVEKVLKDHLTEEDDLVFLPGVLNRLHWLSLGAGKAPTMVSFDTIYPLLSPAVLVSLTTVVSQVEAPMAEIANLIEPFAAHGYKLGPTQKTWHSAWGGVHEHIKHQVVSEEVFTQARNSDILWARIVEHVLSQHNLALASMASHMANWPNTGLNKSKSHLSMALAPTLDRWVSLTQAGWHRPVQQYLSYLSEGKKGKGKAASEGQLRKGVESAFLRACQPLSEAQQGKQSAKDPISVWDWLAASNLTLDGKHMAILLTAIAKHTCSPGKDAKGNNLNTAVKHFVRTALFSHMTHPKLWTMGYAWFLRCSLFDTIQSVIKDQNIQWGDEGFAFWDGLGARVQDMPRPVGLDPKVASNITALLELPLDESGKAAVAMALDGKDVVTDQHVAITQAKYLEASQLPHLLSQQWKIIVNAARHPAAGAIPVKTANAPQGSPEYYISPPVDKALKQLQMAMVEHCYNHQIKLSHPDQDLLFGHTDEQLALYSANWPIHKTTWPVASPLQFREYSDRVTEQSLAAQSMPPVASAPPAIPEAPSPTKTTRELLASLRQTFKTHPQPPPAIKLDDHGLYRMPSQQPASTIAGESSSVSASISTRKRPQSDLPVDEESMEESNRQSAALVQALQGSLKLPEDEPPSKKSKTSNSEAGPSVPHKKPKSANKKDKKAGKW
ncbi:hypothetical protein EVJ58_g9403, partial [Rhodofomes roseus]